MRPGEEIVFSGVTVPNATVTFSIDDGDEITKECQSNGDGAWEIIVDTTGLTVDTFHTAKTFFSLDQKATEDSNEIQSGFSQSINFFVGEGDGPEVFFADLNVDGIVNIIDFSILLFNWGRSGGGLSPTPDINYDGIVDLTDFSIMIFYWTG